MKFTITGIQYQMTAADAGERKQQAIAFVCSMKPETTIYLKAEPDNEWDEKAIAVYLNYRKIGYIASEQTRWLHPLFEQRSVIKTHVSHGDQHITLFCEVPVSAAITEKWVSHTRVIPACPLDPSVCLPFKEEERQLELVTEVLLSEEWNDEGQVDEFLELVERYVPLAKLSLCDEDCLSARLIANRLDMFHEALGALPEDKEKQWLATWWKLRDILGDRHREGGSHDILLKHLDRLQKRALQEDGLFAKFDTFYFETSLEQAPVERIIESLNVLKEWLNKLPKGSYRLHKQEKEFAKKLNYLKLSRVELYEVLAVYLLFKRMEAYLKAHPVSNPLKASADPQPQVRKHPSPRGPRKQFLFIDGKPTVENVAVRQREKERFCRYLSDHKLGSRLLTCLKQDTLNKVVICFLKEWREREWIAEKPSGVAVFRFLTEVCELQSELHPSSYGNKISKWLEQPVDVTIKLDVRECFKE